MFIDTSAVVAILTDEPEADRFLDALDALVEGRGAITAPHVRLESCMILARTLGLELAAAEALFDDFLIEARITVVPITDVIGRRAVSAFSRYGKGRGHPAQLNFGDCLSYACASDHGSPILFKGADFAHTDLAAALV